MAPLKVLICGGGIGGPALGFWLARSGHNVTIVERYPSLRASGAQIDLRAQGIEVIKKMGLLDAIRAKLVDEAGVAIVDRNNVAVGTILANTSGKGAQSLTSEFEIMRGDLVRIMHNVTQDQVKYIFGKTVEHFEQDSTGVTVHLSDGLTDRYDLLVGADGQGSRVRKAILPDDAPDPFLHLGIYVAYYIMPRIPDDTNIRKSYYALKRRLMMCRSHCSTETQGYLWIRNDEEATRLVPKAPVEQQKAFFDSAFHDAGWQTERFLKGMHSAEDFYCQEIVQVHIDSWSKGRVGLIGDAAHCPSPFTAMGTTSALVGAYVLAGELSECNGDISEALARYETTMRPFVKEIQKFSPGLIRFGFLQSQWAVTIAHWFLRLIMFLQIPYWIARFSNPDKGGWSLPVYSKLESATD